MVHLHDITVEKGRFSILQDVSFHVERGEFVFLIGPSGAGKSTVLRVIHLDQKPTKGSLVLEGRDAATLRPKEIPLWRTTTSSAPKKAPWRRLSPRRESTPCNGL